MQITLKTLNDSFANLGKLSAIDAGQGLTARQAYWISRVAETVEAEMKRLEKQRVSLVKLYGVPDKDGNYTVPPDKLDDFAKAIEELFEVEIDLPGEPLKFSELGDLKLSAIDFLRLRWLIVDDAEAAPIAAAASGD